MSEGIQESYLSIPHAEVDKDSNLANALKLYEDKSFSAALDILLPICGQDKSGQYATIIGNCYQKLGAVNDAISYWQKAISQNPACYTAFLGLGSAAYSKNNIKQALIYWHIALSIYPDNPQINYNLATTYSRKNERFLSVYYFEKFLKYSRATNDKDYKYVISLITSLRMKATELIQKASKAISENKINLAVQYYIKAIKNYPIQPKVAQNIAKVFTCDRNFDKAIEYYKSALKMDNNLKICFIDIANIYISQYKYELAYCYFTRFLRSYEKKSSPIKEIEKLAEYVKGKMNATYDATQHFTRAINYENELKYREALDEYENYAILTNENEERVQESIKKLTLIIYPEKTLLKKLISEIEELAAKGCYEETIPLCDRVVRISPINSRNAHWANKKKQEFLNMVFRKKYGKKK